MSSGTQIIELIRNQALLMQGTGLELAVVTSVEPLTIKIHNTDMALTREFLLLSEKFEDHKLEISEGSLSTNGTTTESRLHRHKVLSLGINSGEMIAKNPLSVGDQVIVMSMNNGQKYYILDKVV